MTESIIEKQIGILQSILSNIAEEDKNGSVDFIEFTKEYFGFDKKSGWSILMNVFYVVEDTELAKKDFNQFGLQGPSRHKNVGEKYLRLYGILNSLYQQYLALLNLMELFKLDSREELIQKIRDSVCIKLRNKIAAHSTNYSEDRNNTLFNVYEISRPELEKGNIRLLRNQEEFESYDLDFAIRDFNKEAQKILSLIVGKFLKKKFNNQVKYYTEFQKVEKLRNGAIEFGGELIEFEK